MFAYYAIGAGILILAEVALAIPCTVVLSALLMRSEDRRRRPKYWLALGCFVQPFVAWGILAIIGAQSPYFDTLLLVSAGFLIVGPMLAAIWPDRDGWNA